MQPLAWLARLTARHHRRRVECGGKQLCGGPPVTQIRAGYPILIHGSALSLALNIPFLLILPQLAVYA